MKKIYNYEEMQYTENELKLIESHENLVYYTWSKLDNNWIKTSYRNELLSAGFKGLCTAAKSYKPEKGKFTPHGYMWIYRMMMREIKSINRIYKNIISLDEPIYNQKTMKEEYLKDRVADESIDIEKTGIDKEYAEHVWRLIFKYCNQKEIKIFYMYCYNGLNFSEIAKEIGVSRQRVIQIVQNARKKILQKANKCLT